jgi:hypothetical protein
MQRSKRCAANLASTGKTGKTWRSLVFGTKSWSEKGSE